MIVVQAYLYPNTVEVQVFDPTIFSTRNRQVYSRTVKVYQGVDNPIQIIVKNQDQKKVDLTGYDVVAQIQDPTNQLTVTNFTISFSDRTTGLGNFVIDKVTLDSLEQRFYKLTFKTVSIASNTEAPMYIDDNYGVPLDLQILPAYWSNMGPAVLIGQSVIDGGNI